MNNFKIIIACVMLVLVGSRLATAADLPGRRAPVLLTFDIEIEADIAAFEQLDPPGSCTLFVTGEFAQAHPELVKRWSARHEIACHTMTHPHLTQLEPAQQFAEIRDSAQAIRKATGSLPLGFRAPYLEANDETREALVELGFRYQSSAWEINHRDKSDGNLIEFPIADGVFKERIIVAGDYNLFTSDHFSDDDALTFLLKLFNERRLSGRPLVILLHPHLAAAHAGVFRRFIERAQNSGADWTCFRDWIDAAERVEVKHRAAWVDVDATVYEPEDLVGPARRMGLSDLIVKAYDPYDGALFGPGRENDGFFNGMIDEAHRAGIKIHAWFPICFDPQRLKQHPEWGMVDANGQRSDEWVCPTNAGWRKEFLAMFKALLDNYGVDGIHFDYIRFPNAEVCQCPACRKELSRRAGVAWPLGMDLIDDSSAQATWFDYRTDLIHDVAEEFATTIRKWQEGVVVSAAFKPEGAINFDGVKLYGQSYHELAPLFDFVAPMAYHQLEGEPVPWVRAVQLSARWRSGATRVWNGIQAYQAREHAPMDMGEFGRLLDSMHTGSDGVALFALGPLLSLVTEGEREANLPPGGDELVGRWAQGQTVGPKVAATPAARGDLVDMKSRPVRRAEMDDSVRGSGYSWIWGALAGGLIVALASAARERSRSGRSTVAELPVNVLETLAAEEVLTGPQSGLLLRRLLALGPAELERIWTVALLRDLGERNGDDHRFDSSAVGANPIALARARAAGWIDEADGLPFLTSTGRQHLDASPNRSDSPTWVRFVEARLSESLTVTCPSCASSLPGLWLRGTYGCPSCHIRFPIEQSPTVVIHGRKRRDGSVDWVEQTPRAASEARSGLSTGE